jgi:hypothetical protein
MKTLDELLLDVRESSEMNDWCIVCGRFLTDAKADGWRGCADFGYSNTAPVSVRAILERLDEDARTIEQLTRSVQMVKDAEIATLRQQHKVLSNQIATRDQCAEELFAKLFGKRDPEFSIEIDLQRRLVALTEQRTELQAANTREVERCRELEAELSQLKSAPPIAVDIERLKRQRSVSEWCARAFGADHASSIPQRAVRLLEEAIEAYQSAAGDAEMAHRLIDYVFERPAGSLAQELGGIGVTLLALAEAANLDAEVEEVREVRRVMSKPLDHFRDRNDAKNAAGFEVLS